MSTEDPNIENIKALRDAGLDDAAELLELLASEQGDAERLRQRPGVPVGLIYPGDGSRSGGRARGR